MDLFTAIEQRHSYRGGFTTDPIPRDHLCRIVQAGLQAPSGCNAQTTSFVIIDDPVRIAEIAVLLDRKPVREARALIVCIAEHRAVYNSLSFAVEDCAAAVENMLLAITALGYASVWLDGVLRVNDHSRKIGRILGVPETREVRILLPVGRPSEAMTLKEKLPFEKRAWFNHYESPA
jgi:nitroreductase